VKTAPPYFKNEIVTKPIRLSNLRFLFKILCSKPRKNESDLDIVESAGDYNQSS
jgi:hypothetical protein